MTKNGHTHIKAVNELTYFSSQEQEQDNGRNKVPAEEARLAAKLR
jgi:hypothetical protein